MEQTEMQNVEPAVDSRFNQIGIMLQVMNNMMEDCEANNIDFNLMVGAAQNIWSLRNQKNSFYCGRPSKNTGAALNG